MLYKKAACLFIHGGDEGDRTPDLGIANAALSQLSYIPTFFQSRFRVETRPTEAIIYDAGDACQAIVNKGLFILTNIRPFFILRQYVD